VPWNYDLLQEHFDQLHPEILKSFKEGWAALPDKVRQNWSQFGRIQSFTRTISDDESDDECPNPREAKFTNWTECMYRCSRRERLTSRDDIWYTTVFRALMRSLKHEGALYGFQPLPRATTFEKYDGELKNLERLKGLIAIDAIDRYLEVERIESLYRLHDKIKEHGSEALLSYFKDNRAPWPQLF
jgi:hypothetical protein